MSTSRNGATANDNAEAALLHALTGGAEPVLIAGGGIGGLATAIALARRGIPAHVLERRESFEEEGAGIQLGPNGTRILQSLGVVDALRPRAGVPECIRVRDGASGGELACLPLGTWIAERHGAPYWVVHRKDLHAALLKAARSEPLVALATGFAVAEAASNETHAAVANGAGQTRTGRALVVADGVWSTIRAKLFETPIPRFSGRSAARSVIAREGLPAEVSATETGVWLFPNAHVVHYPVSGGEELAIIVVVNDDHGDQQWSAPVHSSWVGDRLPACAKPLRALIEAASAWKKWGLHRLPAQPSWTRGRIVLLGDAAHPVMPFLAQGGVLALEDAAVLSQEMAAEGPDVVEALRSYEHRRLPRAHHVADASRINGLIYHLSGPMAAARNLTLRMASGERIMSRYDWVYSWRAE